MGDFLVDFSRCKDWRSAVPISDTTKTPESLFPSAVCHNSRSNGWWSIEALFEAGVKPIKKEGKALLALQLNKLFFN
ncbi:MAG: hypothetical protein CBB70_03020 [Planctomycetaceae bacterium TMED10]|nr:MAG: hypothetical protein CBB70_03020 [Planctomycetaceae bacterium TMED10]